MSDGGPAFPQMTTDMVGSQPYTQIEGGLSLRDWFAGQALAGVCNTLTGASWTFEMRAEWAFKQADAMLAERERKP